MNGQLHDPATSPPKTIHWSPLGRWTNRSGDGKSLPGVDARLSSPWRITLLDISDRYTGSASIRMTIRELKYVELMRSFQINLQMAPKNEIYTTLKSGPRQSNGLSARSPKERVDAGWTTEVKCGRGNRHDSYGALARACCQFRVPSAYQRQVNCRLLGSAVGRCSKLERSSSTWSQARKPFVYKKPRNWFGHIRQKCIYTVYITHKRAKY